MTKNNQVLSCIQPTGHLHLGNYFGAVRNWVEIQEDYECIYGVVDYHAMTMPYDVKKLRANTWELITNLVAVGVQPYNIFIQSLVPEHAELSWIFNCFCSYGRLTNMTQFKDKSQDTELKGSFISAGLLDYPVLQAADILIYNAGYVPVGKDQEQHLELSREIAARFNHSVGKEYFVMPEPLYTETPKIKSTADPTRKMSKSAGEKHYINVFEDANRIRKQIKSAVTDSGDNISDQMSAGVANLFEILSACKAEDTYNGLMNDYKNGVLKYGHLKEGVAEELVKTLAPFKEKKAELSTKEAKKELKYQIKMSSYVIRKKAQKTMSEVKQLVGLMNVKF
ncbi:MAG: tryptophan--tRNA ligase [Saprospiraceae bacterium]